jgi:hypothetical protein
MSATVDAMRTHVSRTTGAGWAAALTAGYGTLALIWMMTGRGFPFGRGDPGNDSSPLRDLTPEVGAPLFAGVLLLAAVAALVMNGRADLPRPARIVLLGYVWAVVAALLILAPDSRVLTLAGYLPILIAGAPFGYPPIDYGDVFTATLGNQVLCIVVGLVLGRAALRWQFRTSGACMACGRGEVESRWAGQAAAARWGRWATWTAAAIPASYALVRLSWAAGIPLGISRDFLTEMQDTGLVWAGAGLGAFALAGAVLTLGLVQRWGEVFPRWMIGLAGRPVPIKLATVPAALVAVIVASASVGFLTADGFLTEFTGGLSLATLPMVLWPLWGVALGAAALAYHLRRRPVCAECGRGGDPVEGLVRPRTADAY